MQLLEQEIAITHFIAWHHDALEFLANQFFDVGQSALFFAADKRDGDTCLAGAAGATDTVHIVFCQEGQIVIDHILEIRNIQAAGGHFGGYQYPYLAFLEFSERPAAAALGFFTVHYGTGDTVEIQLLDQMIRIFTGGGKHQHLLPVLAPDKFRQEFTLAALLYRVDYLADGHRCGVLAVGRDDLGLVHYLIGQAPHRAREGGREHQILPLLGGALKYFVDIVDKAHIQHTVCFIQYQHFQRAQTQVTGQ